jgi:predicted nucleic acid-binding protein
LIALIFFEIFLNLLLFLKRFIWRLKIARTIYGLHVIGSARVLVEAKRHALLDNVGAALQAMRNGGYWIGDSIVDAALKQAGEI